ncbi:ABATE domain-containing protein, partial [Pseudomonas sp. SIMBA_059]
AGEEKQDDEPAMLARALALREALYRLFLAQAERREPHADDLALLGGFLASAFDWRAPFWFLCAYGVLITLLVIIWLPETR